METAAVLMRISMASGILGVQRSCMLLCCLLTLPSRREKGLESLSKCFLCLAQKSHDCTYANANVCKHHMIAELAEPRISTNVLKHFPCMCGGIWEQDYAFSAPGCEIYCNYIYVYMYM